MIRTLVLLFISTVGLAVLPCMASAATANVTISTGENLYMNASGSIVDGTITIVNLSNSQTVASITAYNWGSYYLLSGSAYSPASFVQDGAGSAHISGLPAGSYSVTVTSGNLVDYWDNYGEKWAELALFDPNDPTPFLECDVNIY